MPSDRPLIEAGFPWRSDDIVLRPLSDADLDYLVEYRNLEEVWQLQDWEIPYERDRAENLIPATPGTLVVGEWQQIGIESAGRLVGDLAILVPSPGDDAWIGYSLHPENWGRGLATRAVAHTCRKLFEFGAARVRASVDRRNLASISLLERLGFSKDNEINRIEVRGEIYDDAVYSLLPSLRAVGTEGS